jgi:predicted O-methyltransferase YrrM
MERFFQSAPASVGDRLTGALVGPSTIAARARSRDVLERCLEVQRGLSPDPYTTYVIECYERALETTDGRWEYMDILSVLLACAEMGRPRRYLEIGVRRGRSMAAVARGWPACDVVGFDLWQAGYGGNENPGPDLVRRELERVGHRGAATFVSGDSARTVPEWFRAHPDDAFDLVTVDGDHSVRGAWRDLSNTAPRLAPGGVIVFDDIANPYCPGLRRVWRRLVASDGGLLPYEYDEVGCGVAFAVRARPPRRRSGSPWKA